jgi:hypothetical protein
MLPQQPAFCGNGLGSSIVPLDGTGAAIEHRPWDAIVGRWRTSRRRVAEKEAAGRRATDPQILEDAEQLVTAKLSGLFALLY